MSADKPIIRAQRASISPTAKIDPSAILAAESIRIGDGTVIGPHVRITADNIDIGDSCSIGERCHLLAPSVRLSEQCSIGKETEVSFNQHFHLGARSSIGRRVIMSGQGFECGEFLWMKGEIIIGGGGATGPHSFLTIGRGVTIIDRCYINLSEAVTIGDNVALSYNVVLLTHGAWQSPLLGYPAKFAPIMIHENAVIYLNCTILPGVTVGRGSVVASGSVVLHDVPDQCLVGGNPAKLLKGPGYPKPLDPSAQLGYARALLKAYLETLPHRGIRVHTDADALPDTHCIEHAGRTYVVHLVKPEKGQLSKRPDITLSVGRVDEALRGICHFQLQEPEMFGETSPIAEDLRDYLRRNGFRILGGRPFRPISLPDVTRLSNQLRSVLDTSSGN
jgi:acetyltransferase-like isoleucine patch superfamily enzyme